LRRDEDHRFALAKKTCKTRADWIAQENFDPLAPER
jgi:hypothetical protein